MSAPTAGRDAQSSSPAAPGYGWLAALLLVILVLYLYPLAATRAHLGPSPLPPLFAPDLYCYLNLSNPQTVAPHVVANPWYGLPVPEAATGYGKFGLSFVLFGVLRRLLGGSWWAAVAIWTALWTLLICLAAVWLLRRLLPQGNGMLLGLSTALLLLADLHTLPALLAAWLHLPSLRGFEGVALPYARSFFPQVAIPLVLAYIGLQVDALQKRRWLSWLGMAAVQGLAFVLFPYAMLLMAGITGLVLLLALLARRLQPSYAQIAGFGLLCALLDAAYLFHGGAGAISAGGPLVVLDPALLLHLLLSKTLWLVLVVTALVGLLRAERPEVKWTLVSLGGTTALLLLADGVISPALQIANHGLYFVHTTLTLQLAYLLAMVYPALLRRIPRLRWALPVFLVLILADGALTAHGNYRALLPFNQVQKDKAGILVSLDLQPDDMVIADARFVDDTGCWLPLLSRARVLFCRDAEFALLRADEDRVQRLRQALYLYFAGRDPAWVDQVLSPAGDFSEQNFLSLTLERLDLEGPQRAEALASLKALIDSRLALVEQGDPAARLMFGDFRRIVVLDRADDPLFERSRIAKYLRIEREERRGDYVLLWCKPI